MENSPLPLFLLVTAARSLPESLLLRGDLIAFVLPQKSLMPHEGFGTFKVQINRLGPCQRVGVGSEMDLLGDPAWNAGNGRLPERKPVIEGVLLGNPSDQILVTAQQHPDSVFPMGVGKAALGDQRTENITEAGVAIQWESTEFAAPGEPDLNLGILGCLVHDTPL